MGKAILKKKKPRSTLDRTLKIAVKDEVAYVRRLRKKDKSKSDKEFLEEIRRWERIKFWSAISEESALPHSWTDETGSGKVV